MPDIGEEHENEEGENDATEVQVRKFPNDRETQYEEDQV